MYEIVRKGYIKVYRVEADESFSFVSHHVDEAEAISAANNHGEASGGGRYVLSYPNKEVDVGRIVIQGPAPTTAVLTVLPVVGSGSELDVELATPSTGPAAPYTYRLEEAPAAVGPFTTIASGTVFTGSPPRFRRGGLSESATRHYRVIATDSASPARSTLSAVAQGVTHDVTPAAFDFADVSNAAQAALTQSNSITITGITTPVPISVSGGEYRVNSGAWLTAQNTIANGNTVQVRTTSASAPDTPVTVTLTISTLTADWIVRTAATSGLTWPLQAPDGRTHVLPGINIYGSDSYGGSGRNPASTGVNTYIINNGSNSNIVTDGVAAGFGADSFQCTLEGFLRHDAGTRSKIGIIARSGIINFDKRIQSVGSNWSLLGQFAPSPGFYIRGLEINALGADHYNVWHLPIFIGNASWVDPLNEVGDGFVIGNAAPGHATNWIFINCEFSRSADELFDGSRPFDNCGFIFCAFYEPLGDDVTGSHIHQFGPLLGSAGGEPLKVSFARCLFANSVDRNPWIGSHRSLSENCIGYNHGRHVTGVGLGFKYSAQWPHSTAVLHNLVRTMFVRGPNNDATMVAARATEDTGTFPASSGVFIAGCVQNGWSNPGSQSGFLTNTETNFAVKAAIQTAALPSGRLTSLGDTVAIASNPNSPTAAEKQAFFDLMKISVGANPSYRTTSIGRMQIVLNQIQARLNGTTGEGEQIPTAPTDAAAGGWWTVPVTVVDPLNPGAHWHAPMPTAASRHTPHTFGTFSNGMSRVGYTPMEVWWIEQHYFRGGQPQAAGGGGLVHGAPATVTGSGFGTKSTAAPTVRDDCMHGQSIATRWDGSVPSNGTPSSVNLAYASDTFSIGYPHSRVNKILTGSHGGQNTATAGNNVGVWKNRTFGSFPGYMYASWYVCLVPTWTIGADFNYKYGAYNGATGGPYELPNNWYLSNAFPPSFSQYRIHDDGGGALNPAFTTQAGPIVEVATQGTWFHYEWEARLATDTSGYIRVWVNNALKQSYDGRTDNFPGTGRSVLIGGYQGNTPQNPDNRRAFADIYLDFSDKRLVLANNSSITAATIVVPQVCSSWADGRIDFTVNGGPLSAGTVYLFVRNAGSWVAAGSRTLS